METEERGEDRRINRMKGDVTYGQKRVRKMNGSEVKN